MENKALITFTKADRDTLQQSATSHSVIDFLNIMIEELSPGFFTLIDDVTLSITLNISALHMLFQTEKRADFNDASGIVDHILFEFGMQHSDDIKEAITETLNSIPLNGAEQLTQRFLHFEAGTERTAVDEYLKSAYPS